MRYKFYTTSHKAWDGIIAAMMSAQKSIYIEMYIFLDDTGQTHDFLGKLKSDILLAKRHHTKIHNPNKWGPAVSGTVEKGETYESNIIKETEEEIGLKNVKLKLGPKTETDSEYHHFTQWYFLNIDLDIDDFKIKEDEVEEIKWFSPEWLKTRLEKYTDEFVPRMDYYFKTFSLPD